MHVSIKNPVRIAGIDVFFPHCPPPLIGSKLCPFFTLTSWVAAVVLSSPHFFGYSLLNKQKNFKVNCASVRELNFIADICLRAVPFVYVAIAFALIIIICSLISFNLKSQKTPGEQSVNAVKQSEKKQKDVLKNDTYCEIAFLCLSRSNI